MLVAPGAAAAAHGVVGPPCPQGRPSLNTGAPQLLQRLMGAGCRSGIGDVLLMQCSKKKARAACARRAGVEGALSVGPVARA